MTLLGKRLLFLVAALSSLFVLMALAGGCTKASVTTTTAGGAPAAEGTTETTAAEAPPAETTETTAAEAPAEKPAEEAPAGDGKAVVDKVCSACHGLKGITGPGKGAIAGFESFKGQDQMATKRDWAATVTRMKDTNKCPMTPEEEKTIVEWLNANVK